MVGKAIDPATNQQTSGQATLELVPVAMNVTVRSEGRSSEVFAGFGPAFVAFNDRSPTNAISGMKLGLDMRLGIRIHTNFIQQSMRPGAGGFKRMDVELLLGRRQHQPGFGSGFDLSHGGSVEAGLPSLKYAIVWLSVVFVSPAGPRIPLPGHRRRGECGGQG